MLARTMDRMQNPAQQVPVPVCTVFPASCCSHSSKTQHRIVLAPQGHQGPRQQNQPAPAAVEVQARGAPHPCCHPLCQSVPELLLTSTELCSRPSRSPTPLQCLCKNLRQPSNGRDSRSCPAILHCSTIRSKTSSPFGTQRRCFEAKHGKSCPHLPHLTSADWPCSCST